MSDVLITGITGSGGSYLAEYLINNHSELKVHGICRWHSTTTKSNIGHIEDEVHIYECDLLDLGSIIRTLEKVKPKIIFHLAAYANVKKCFDTPLSVIYNNIMGTANLLEAIRMVCPSAVLQMCSTSEVYGNPTVTPITEEHPISPVNPYAASKLAQESLAYSYHKSWGVDVVITRMFAYINPRRNDLFASAFAEQVVRVEKGLQDKILHGNLKSVRTLIDVRDAMEAYWLAAIKCDFGTPYNIGGAESIEVGEVLQLLIDKSHVDIKTEESVDLLRPVDITLQIPDSTKFLEKTGWKPKYSLDDSIEFLLEAYRRKYEQV